MCVRTVRSKVRARNLFLADFDVNPLSIFCVAHVGINIMIESGSWIFSYLFWCIIHQSSIWNQMYFTHFSWAAWIMYVCYFTTLLGGGLFLFLLLKWSVRCKNALRKRLVSAQTRNFDQKDLIWPENRSKLPSATRKVSIFWISPRCAFWFTSEFDTDTHHQQSHQCEYRNDLFESKKFDFPPKNVKNAHFLRIFWRLMSCLPSAAIMRLI